MCAGWVAFISTQFTHFFSQQVIPRTAQKLFNTLKHTFKNNFIILSLPKYKHIFLKLYPFLVQREKKVLIIENMILDLLWSWGIKKSEPLSLIQSPMCLLCLMQPLASLH